MRPKQGDFVEIVTKKETIKGICMPQEGESIVIKLENGYNIGINKDNIKSIKVIREYKEKKESKTSVKQDSRLPIISILHTGGTIASKVDYETGGVIARFTPEELISMFPELKKIANIKSRLLKNMWSQDMRFCHYNLIAKEIKKELSNGAQGVIVTHGTDTLHYTAAALAFVLEDLPKPVLVVGAQRSSDRGSSDAFLNLINATYFIANSDFGEVGICMHENMDDENCLILPATKSRKFHTSRRDAFKAINTRPWARVNYMNKKIEFLKKNYSKTADKNLKLKLFNENIKVGIIKQHTNMYAEQFLAYRNYEGLVIESTGLGCLPITKADESTKEEEKIFKAIQTLIKNGVVVVEAPQTIFGRLNLNVYEDQRKAQEIGVLGNLNDMTPETTFIKLAWLLSNYPKQKVNELITTNLRGEIAERTEEIFL